MLANHIKYTQSDNEIFLTYLITLDDDHDYSKLQKAILENTKMTEIRVQHQSSPLYDIPLPQALHALLTPESMVRWHLSQIHQRI